MSSPFKMKPGRGNMPKTGRGISPTLMSKSPMKQKDPKTRMTKGEAQEEINKVFSENSRRVAAEAVSKTDSISAADRARILDPKMSKKMAARIGNEAANKRRKQENIPTVTRATEAGSSGSIHGVKTKKKANIYYRNGQLEKDPKKSTVVTYSSLWSPSICALHLPQLS